MRPKNQKAAKAAANRGHIVTFGQRKSTETSSPPARTPALPPYHECMPGKLGKTEKTDLVLHFGLLSPSQPITPSSLKPTKDYISCGNTNPKLVYVVSNPAAPGYRWIPDSARSLERHSDELDGTNASNFWRKLWSEALSASQVAAQPSSITRNAVIGKVRRHKLSEQPACAAAFPRRKGVSSANGGKRWTVPLTVTRSITTSIGATALQTPVRRGAGGALSAGLRTLLVPISRRLRLVQLRRRTCK